MKDDKSFSLEYLVNNNSISKENPTKGEFEQGCNRKSCSNMISDWYNHSTQKYYCRECANVINKFNQEFKLENGYNLCEKLTKPK